jgi:hypothetical protein
MRDSTVKKYVHAYLEKKNVGEVLEEYVTRSGNGKGYRLDFCIRDKGETTYAVECTNSKGNLYRTLGQCMCYYDESRGKYPVYLAIPKDFASFGCTFEDVKEIMFNNGSKFGLMSVSEDGKVEIERRARHS